MFEYQHSSIAGHRIVAIEFRSDRFGQIGKRRHAGSVIPEILAHHKVKYMLIQPGHAAGDFRARQLDGTAAYRGPCYRQAPSRQVSDDFQ